jgi:serpin B
MFKKSTISTTLSLIVLLLFGLLFVQCSKSTDNSGSGFYRELTMPEKSLIESDNTFGFNLFKEIVSWEDSEKNIFISPLSVSMALGMTYQGAGGTTQDDMRKTLKLSGLSEIEIREAYKSLIELLTHLDPKVQFDIANSIWFRKGWAFEEDFLAQCDTYFNAEIAGLNFNDPASVDIINAWVFDNTNGRIEEIVDLIDSTTVMFLINAIYFLGTWTYEFDKDETIDGIFTLPDSSTKPCKMMVQENKFLYYSNHDFQAIDLPYGDGYFSMTILLPRSHIHIDSLIAKLNNDNWNLWISRFTKQEGTLILPKFKLEYEIKLNDVLKALGMEIAFNPRLADFTRMYPERILFISKVKHKTFVKVDEEGTEAAAVTSVEISYTSTGFTIRLDRPFIFVIRENHSQTILFMGKIVEPEWES